VPDDELFIPAVAQRMADNLTRDTGVAPTVRKYVTGYLLEHSSKRVRMTIHYKKRSGKWSWAGSTLTLDGKRQMLAHGYEDYVEIFNCGERRPLKETSAVVDPPVLGEEVPRSDAPTGILQYWDKILNALPPHRRKGLRLSLHKNGDGYILVDQVADISMYTYFDGDGGTEHDPFANLLVLFAENDLFYDVTDRFVALSGDIEALIAEMVGSEPVRDVPRQIRRASEPKRFNSVEVRRTTVIRV
jgi:hypothetical protein